MTRRKINREELCAVLAGHLEWLESSREHGSRADLKFCDLSGMNLQQARLEDADMEGADFSRANLRLRRRF